VVLPAGAVGVTAGARGSVSSRGRRSGRDGASQRRGRGDRSWAGVATKVLEPLARHLAVMWTIYLHLLSRI